MNLEASCPLVQAFPSLVQQDQPLVPLVHLASRPVDLQVSFPAALYRVVVEPEAHLTQVCRTNYTAVTVSASTNSVEIQ